MYLVRLNDSSTVATRWSVRLLLQVLVVLLRLGLLLVVALRLLLRLAALAPERAGVRGADEGVVLGTGDLHS